MKVLVTLLALALIVFGGGCTLVLFTFANLRTIFATLGEGKDAELIILIWVFGGLLPIIIGVTVMFFQKRQDAKSRPIERGSEAGNPGESLKSEKKE